MKITVTTTLEGETYETTSTAPTPEDSSGVTNLANIAFSSSVNMAMMQKKRLDAISIKFEY